MIRWSVVFEAGEDVMEAIVDTMDDGTFLEAVAHARYSVPDDFYWTRVTAERVETDAESFG